MGHRLAVDVRSIDAGEKAYLLAHAAALLELGSNVIAAGDWVHDALRQSVPVIAVKDADAKLKGVAEPTYPSRHSRVKNPT